MQTQQNRPSTQTGPEGTSNETVGAVVSEDLVAASDVHTSQSGTDVHTSQSGTDVHTSQTGEEGAASRTGTPETASAEADSATTYADAGVHIEAGEEAVERMRPWAQQATRPEVLGSLGGFAGLFQLKLDRWTEPVLASATDGVGTKIALAQALDMHDTVGIDLVAMVADDLVVCGAEPLFLQDYIAVGQVVPERIAALVKGVSEGCVQAGCALLGGETAEHPGMMDEHEYDISATAVGVVEAGEVLGPDRVRPGDVVIAMGSSGLHSNGYSLARHVLLDKARMPLTGHVEEFGRTLGEELLEPTRIYAKDCLSLVAEAEVRTFAHVTGGGLAANLARVIPNGLTAVLDRGTWTPEPVFRLIAQRGRIEREEMERTFNMGVGMVAVVTAEDVDRALAMLTARHVPAWVIGEAAKTPAVEEAENDERVVLRGNHPRF